MRVGLARLGALLTLATGIACAKEPPSPSSASPSAALETPDFAAAFTATPRFEADAVVVDLQLRPGFHVYTTGERTGRPIRLELLTDSAWIPGGDAQYPEGRRKKTALGESVVVEGQAEARLAVKAQRPEPGPVQGTFHYQVCTDHACDRPRKLSFAVGPSAPE